MRTSKRKLPKEVQTAGVIIIGALLTAILLKIAFSEKSKKMYKILLTIYMVQEGFKIKNEKKKRIKRKFWNY